MDRFRSLLQDALTKSRWLSMIFPASCVSCGRELERSQDKPPKPAAESDEACDSHKISFQDWQDNHWCSECWSGIYSRQPFRCTKCSACLPKPSPFSHSCNHCHQLDLRFDRALSVSNYQGLLKHLVIQMKNRNDVLATQLGLLLAFEIVNQGWSEFDFLIPVPSHWTRHLKRGFQAAEILGGEVSAITGIPQRMDLVKAVRATAKQGTLSGNQRQVNVRNAFSVVSPAKVSNKKILIIDDVMTSGSTVSEIARVLKKEGASEVDVAVLARGAGVSGA